MSFFCLLIVIRGSFTLGRLYESGFFHSWLNAALYFTSKNLSCFALPFFRWYFSFFVFFTFSYITSFQKYKYLNSKNKNPLLTSLIYLIVVFVPVSFFTYKCSQKTFNQRQTGYTLPERTVSTYKNWVLGLKLFSVGLR